MSIKISVLDLISVNTRQRTADAIAASLELVELADRLGVHRYWFAEHHNMKSVAATNPALLIAAAAARTSRMRLGSGGVMLPNHSPLVVAEQFALLAETYGDRIDLGLGRAPGSDPVVSYFLRRDLPSDAQAQDFPEHVIAIAQLLSKRGLTLQLGPERTYQVHSSPNAQIFPQIWLLGSSGFSSQLAAQLGLRYVFAHHFAGQGTAAALSSYRQNFTREYEPLRPHQPAQPESFLTLNVVIGATEAEAQALAKPYRLHMARLVTGAELGPLPTVEEAENDATITEAQQRIIDQSGDHFLVGTAESVNAKMRELAARYEVDEVMVHLVAGAHDTDPVDSSPAKIRALQELFR